MPEGPQVRRVALAHAKTLAGGRVRIDAPDGRSDDVAAELDGKRLRGVAAAGKHLLYDFGRDRQLHVHFGRFGKFREVPAPPGDPSGIVRLRLWNDAYAYELRGAIAVDVLDRAGRAALEARIGPNPLDDDADPADAFAKIVARRTAVGLLLMDQSIVAGIGNIYRSEILFVHGVHPFAPGNTLAPDVWRAMWRDLRRLMDDGVRIGRIVTTAQADRRSQRKTPLATDRFYVYHRTGLPCRRCGTSIAGGRLGARSVFWCPQCQPLPPAPVPPPAPGVLRVAKRRVTSGGARQDRRPEDA